MGESPNRTKLALYKASADAIPAGGGISDGIAFLQDAERMKSTLKAAFEWADLAILAVKSAPDNPYESDEEIAAAILQRLDEGKVDHGV